MAAHPPNYLAFRFHGRLQQIRHVEAYDAQDAPWETTPDLAGKSGWAASPHLFYELGPVILPQHTVKTGSLYRAQRVWAALDLLLTSSTVSEARDLTQQRLAAAGEA